MSVVLLSATSLASCFASLCRTALSVCYTYIFLFVSFSVSVSVMSLFPSDHHFSLTSVPFLLCPCHYAGVRIRPSLCRYTGLSLPMLTDLPPSPGVSPADGEPPRPVPVLDAGPALDTDGGGRAGPTAPSAGLHRRPGRGAL